MTTNYKWPKKVLKKEALFYFYLFIYLFLCDDTGDGEKEFSVNKGKEKYHREFKMCIVEGNENCVVVTHKFFLVCVCVSAYVHYSAFFHIKLQY